MRYVSPTSTGSFALSVFLFLSDLAVVFTVAAAFVICFCSRAFISLRYDCSRTCNLLSSVANFSFSLFNCSSLFFNSFSFAFIASFCCSIFAFVASYSFFNSSCFSSFSTIKFWCCSSFFSVFRLLLDQFTICCRDCSYRCYTTEEFGERLRVEYDFQEADVATGFLISAKTVFQNFMPFVDRFVQFIYFIQ